MMREEYKKPEMRSEAIDIGVYGKYSENTPIYHGGGVFGGACCPN